MSDVRISLIIPAYNEERYLAACLDSVANQTVMPDEVIVVDNNSTDRTAEIARSYDFVRLINEPKQGIVHARNAGFNAATGEILARTDADVVLPKDWIKYIKEYYSRPENADLSVTGGGRPNNLRLPRLMGWLQGQIAFRVNRLLLGHYILFGSNMAMPAKIWRRVRPDLCERTDIHEDLDLSIHAHRAGHQIDYHENFRVTGRANRLITRQGELLDNLMMWPRTLKVHGLKTWVFGWLGAVILYVMSPLPVLFDNLARLFGRAPLN